MMSPVRYGYMKTLRVLDYVPAQVETAIDVEMFMVDGPHRIL